MANDFEPVPNGAAGVIYRLSVQVIDHQEQLAIVGSGECRSFVNDDRSPARADVAGDMHFSRDAVDALEKAASGEHLSDAEVTAYQRAAADVARTTISKRLQRQWIPLSDRLRAGGDSADRAAEETAEPRTGLLITPEHEGDRFLDVGLTEAYLGDSAQRLARNASSRPQDRRLQSMPDTCTQPAAADVALIVAQKTGKGLPPTAAVRSLLDVPKDKVCEALAESILIDRWGTQKFEQRLDEVPALRAAMADQLRQGFRSLHHQTNGGAANVSNLESEVDKVFDNAANWEKTLSASSAAPARPGGTPSLTNTTNQPAAQPSRSGWRGFGRG